MLSVISLLFPALRYPFTFAETNNREPSVHNNKLVFGFQLRNHQRVEDLVLPDNIWNQNYKKEWNKRKFAGKTSILIDFSVFQSVKVACVNNMSIHTDYFNFCIAFVSFRVSETCQTWRKLRSLSNHVSNHTIDVYCTNKCK